MKVCCRCEQILSDAAFYRSSTSKDGFGSYCKECLRDYRNQNKERLNERTRARYLKNRDKEIARSQSYNSQHSSARRQYGQQYRQTLSGSFAIYKGNAIAKNRVWELTEEEFRAIVQMPCDYCGSVNARGFNGIDRVHNTLGYTRENSVSCCSMCNYMKRNYTRDEFLNKIQQIYNHNVQS